MTDLGRGGGYIIAPCHNLGHDIRPENTLGFFEMVQKMGRYPLALEADLASNASYFERLKREGGE